MLIGSCRASSRLHSIEYTSLLHLSIQYHYIGRSLHTPLPSSHRSRSSSRPDQETGTRTQTSREEALERRASTPTVPKTRAASNMSGRALQVGGVAILGIGGYYLYNAGGDPKAAQKRAEGMPPILSLSHSSRSTTNFLSADATKIANEIKDKAPGDLKEGMSPSGCPIHATRSAMLDIIRGQADTYPSFSQERKKPK